jgi:hypothetical protein
VSVVSEIESQVQKRLDELRPAYEEYRQLEQVLETFRRAADRTDDGGAPAPPARRARRSGSRSARRRGGARAQQALELVGRRPGITVAELASELGIGTTYLYRVMPALERDGKVAKRGTGYHLT